jgi:hypothetical protein
MIKRLLRLWVVLLCITGAISCWFVVLAMMKGWTYFRLDSQCVAQVEKWDIKMISSSNYSLHATYRYLVDGRPFTGDTLYFSLSFPNRYAAEIDLKERQSQAIHVWYQKKNPAFSSLQRRFPKKELLNAMLTTGVFVYFYFAQGLMSYREKELSEFS